jgi:RNA polymerase sigma factor (sigma-70 family)
MAGDDQALADLYVRCREAMLARAARWAPSRSEAEREDVVADSLLEAIAVLRRGAWQPDEGSFLGWLDRVVRHDLVDAARRRRRGPRLMAPDRIDADTTAGGHGPGTWLVAGEQEARIVAAVRAALAAIKPRYADVLLLRSVLGLEVDEVGKELGLQRRQVIDATYEARRRLFARLERGAADWDVFVQHVEHRIAVDTPRAVRALLRADPERP